MKPAYQFGPTEILTADKLNLLATPVVELALQDPVNDQNFLRNGNFYSSFWTTPAGVTCPAGIWTTNASYWLCRPDFLGTSFTTLTTSFIQPSVVGASSTTLTALFAQPAVNATVTIAVVATVWMTANQQIAIVGGGEYTVSSITDGTHAVIKNLGLTGNVAPAVSVPSGSAAGPTSRVSIVVAATAWMTPTEIIYIQGGGNYSVVSITDATHVVVSNLGTGGSVAPGATVQSGAYLSPSASSVQFSRSTTVPDIYSLFSAKITGAPSVAQVEFGQQINGDLSATLRRNCTFSGYIYNGSGLVLSPQLLFYTADTFNNFSAITLQTTVNVQSAPSAAWTFMTATLDLSTLTNTANGLLVAVFLPAGALNDPAKYVLFSRLKLQIGEVATEFVDDTSLFIQAPSVDATMLQDGCIARPSLFMPNVIPKGAYQAKSIYNGDISDGAIDSRTIAAGTAVANLGYTPINKAGDSAIGPGTLQFNNDTVINTTSYVAGALRITTSSAHGSNTGYMPSIGFERSGVVGRAIGLGTTGRFIAPIGGNATQFYLLDNYFGVANADIQDGAITYNKLAQSLINLICPIAMVVPFAGVSPPSGWFICDGSAVSRTTYAALFAQLGAYWGGGDGVNTFNLPNFVNRVPVGYGGGAAWSFGTYGGEANHQLLMAEIPAHDHGYKQTPHDHGTHAHSYVTFNGSGGSISNALPVPYGAASATTGASAVPAFNANITFAAQGGSGVHNNMPPYGVLYYIIKAV